MTNEGTEGNLTSDLSTEAAPGAAAMVRGREPADILRLVLRDPRLGGAMLVGRRGSGRRSTVERALAGLDPRPTIIHLNGSRFAAQTRYGVLSFLLSRLETSPSITRHELVRAIVDMIGDERTIVTLGNPELIDSESAAVLAQLSAMHRISLIIVCSRPSELPADLSALYRSRMLLRIEVQGMDVGQTMAFLREELGGPVSISAAAAMWRMCRASRDYIRRLTKEFVSQGKLRRAEGIWILAAGPFTISTGMRVPQLANVTLEERRLLRILAVGGPAALSGLRRCGLVDEVSSLRLHGVLTIVEPRSEAVDIGVPLIAHSLRTEMDENQLLSLAGDLAELYADPQCARLLTEARALRDLGDDEAAAAAVDEFRRSGGFTAAAWRIDPIRRSRLLEVQFWSLVALGRRNEAEAYLKGAGEGLAEAVRDRTGDHSLIQAEQLHGLLAAQAAVLDGRTEEIPDLMQTLWETESLHIKALTVQAEAWATGERQADALAIVDVVDADLDSLRFGGVLDQVMSPEQCADIECTLLRVRLLCGEWHAAEKAAARLTQGMYPSPHAVAYGSLVTGLLSALAHEAETAVSILVPAAHQMTAVSQGASPAAARAGAAFCLADLDRDDFIPAASQSDPGLAGGGFLGWVGEVLNAMRLGRDDPRGAAADLLELAARCRDSGRQLLEMAALAAALRFGDTTGAGRLGQLAARSSAPSAHGFALLARGVAERDGEALTAGVEELIAHGQLLYSHGKGGVLLEHLGHRDRRRILARHRDVPGRLADGLETAASDSSQMWLPHLTKRESQIADQAIAGMTNSAIARLNGVSVRTVEGHLYQVYSKLHVRNRRELTVLARTHREE